MADTFKYKVRAGKHIEDAPDGREHIYYQGEVFDSLSPTLAQHYPEKFEAMGPGTAVDRVEPVKQGVNAVPVPASPIHEAAKAGFDPVQSNAGETSPPLPRPVPPPPSPQLGRNQPKGGDDLAGPGGVRRK
jgi:hypothetical protein